MKRIIFSFLLFLASIANAQYYTEHQRRSWYIGFGIGSGYGWYNFAGEWLSFGEIFEGFSSATITLNFKVGATISPNLLVGFDITAIRRQGYAIDGSNITLATQINNYNAILTYFPFKEGFFLRGGCGFAVYIIEAKADFDSLIETAPGFDILLGAGYAFWLGKSFNLTLNADYSMQSYGGGEDKLDGSQFMNIYLGFDWY